MYTGITTTPAVAHVLTQARAMTPVQAAALNRAADADEHDETQTAAHTAALAALFQVSEAAVRGHLRDRVTEAIPLIEMTGAFWGAAWDAVLAAAYAERLTTGQWQTLTGHWTRIMGPMPTPHSPTPDPEQA